MIKITLWLDYESLDDFEVSYLANDVDKMIDSYKCLAWSAEETEVIA